MAKLRAIVSPGDPLKSYSKQKKIGQGASGSVYVARVCPDAPSTIASTLYRKQGPRAQVAIKQMDLRNQPRKELIVNEIIVMKDSRHKNIVNFLDAFLPDNTSELWVVMEFMEGGSLTDVIDNNNSISEEQISGVCLEVRFLLFVFIQCASIFVQLTALLRPAGASNTSTPRTSFIGTSRAITFCSTLKETSKLVSPLPGQLMCAS